MASKVWKLNGRRGIAYVEGKEKAERVLALCSSDTTVKLPDVAMAEYRDKRGRAFAWQIPFDLGRWDAVSAALGEQPSP
jgi:hypothetical protein